MTAGSSIPGVVRPIPGLGAHRPPVLVCRRAEFSTLSGNHAGQLIGDALSGAPSGQAGLTASIARERMIRWVGTIPPTAPMSSAAAQIRRYGPTANGSHSVWVKM